MGTFERYLTLWVGASMVAGLLLGKALPGLTAALRGLEIGQGSHINLPIAVLIWLMIYPMMLKIDFRSIHGPGSDAALATVVGVLVEVPVMLSVCRACLATRHWFPSALSRAEEGT